MKRILLSLALVTVSAASAAAYGVDLPRLSFPSQGEQVTQGCDIATQSCEE
ncbi:hypothetical protein OE699_00065 [Sedimentimonas flavescens]|uniref:Secreted protein n=1 Tax=Sedimentimonas flavescens TaxID=2851012 RepID=A0ABT2ZVB0_9RHOB|nr:hypothetical protein [Sedimentimonas flavescens]MBW0156998.1 hypothetical protein [Sedimentimonas flavescens]MCT2539490.1 hypothetical protein [Sedimentimonas flavescens]MCV2877230.1 hypothetical protein [Sedimentimonas flavescens]WBL32739.1 hypothetical protein O5O51_13585 [Sinirhodobacter sp. HNIBRBA609]